jgi:anaerobic selenocysteine-containing dehydrogenase
MGEYPCAGLADEILASNVRALVVVGGNPVTALPNSKRTIEALRQLEVLAVADVVATDTTALATHIFPCTNQLERADLTHFAEIAFPAVAGQYTPAMVPVGARRKPMWWIFSALGLRLGLDLLPDGLSIDTCIDDDLLRQSVHPGSRATFEQMQASSTAIVAEPAVYGWVERIFLPDGRWRLAPPPMLRMLEEFEHRPAAPGLLLIPHRQLRKMNSGLPSGAYEAPELSINPIDAEASGITDGSVVLIKSSTGGVQAVARFTEKIRPGAVSLTHGFADTNVSELTSEREGVDPLTGMIQHSGVPVSVGPAQ